MVTSKKFFTFVLRNIATTAPIQLGQAIIPGSVSMLPAANENRKKGWIKNEASKYRAPEVFTHMRGF